ncbi:RNA polymerase sigma factor RpoH [Azospirillum doebereinerae]|uniref:RNA polymerase sigma factor RpoH n=1 Tax=Azospirillum doebereinerae TaxID=92933 RepID=A0A3S1CHB7_9PROT|nr:RNA polymerase sigma factor RpoH [Azospirillum doebereinerae]MCG5243896.1 RNA polymerase sigma factor RpoH [Azospirillum doebereinerae]RUQ71512.1 RNA polymerase sigma factor RpoH [Azospirillum doebereinerae]
MSTALALRSTDSGELLSRYINETHRYPVLAANDEFMLAKAWTEHGDVKAAHALVTSHLRLVVKIASGYRGYGLPLTDLVAEGNLGLMTAVKKFEPDRGFRLSTYAMWWIKASIQDYILRSWSLVKIGTTAAQKKLFFSLGRLKRKLGELGSGDLLPENVTRIANDLEVGESDVVTMNRRLSGPVASLNAPIASEGDSEWQDLLADERPTVEDTLVERGEAGRRSALLRAAMDVLNERERDILTSRRLSEKPLTLEDLAVRYGVSRERIRQIEERAFAKVAKQTLQLAAAA